MLSFTQCTQSVSLGKCSTIVSNRSNRLNFNIERCSNICLPLALIPTDVDYYVFFLAYVVRQLSFVKSVFPKVINSCIPKTCNTIQTSISLWKEYLETVIENNEWLCSSESNYYYCLSLDGLKSIISMNPYEHLQSGKQE